MKVQEGGVEVRKDVLQTEAEQKLLRNMMRGEFQSAKRELARELKAVINEEKNKQTKDFDDTTEE
jgi:predicted secreted Zn-dependent protease